MKKIGIYSMAILMLGISTLSTGCMGSFTVSKKLYKWNQNVTGNKFVNHLIFWVLCCTQIYSLCFVIIDGFVLNLIEFWSGSNPMSMAPGDIEKQTVMGKDGNTYEITATQNRFDIVQLSGDKKGTKQSLLFNPDAQSCSMVIDGVEKKLLKHNTETNMMEIFRPDGSSIVLDADTKPDMALQMLRTDAVFASK